MYLSFAICYKVGKTYPAHSYREAVCVCVWLRSPLLLCFCLCSLPSLGAPCLGVFCLSGPGAPLLLGGLWPVCLFLLVLFGAAALLLCGFWRCLRCSCLFPCRFLAPWACRLCVPGALCSSFCLSVAPFCRVSLSWSPCFTHSLLHMSWNQQICRNSCG